MNQPGTKPVWVDALLGLRGEEFRLWSYLYWRQGNNDRSWPDQATIAIELRLSVEAIRKITKRLASAGWLVVTWSGPGQGHRKMYTVQHPDRPAETPTAVPVSGERNPNDGLGLDERNPNGGTAETPTAVPRHIRRTLTRTLSTKEKRKRAAARTAPFVVPTVEQVAAYGQEIGYAVNAEKFVAHYESTGWKVGKSPMKDWRAAVRTWRESDRDRPAKQVSRKLWEVQYDGVMLDPIRQ